MGGGGYLDFEDALETLFEGGEERLELVPDLELRH
jgi:hypothetical protein